MMCMLLFRNAAVWENFTAQIVGVTWSLNLTSSDGGAEPHNFWAPSAQQLVGWTGIVSCFVVVVVNGLYCYVNMNWGWKIVRRAMLHYVKGES